MKKRRIERRLAVLMLSSSWLSHAASQSSWNRMPVISVEAGTQLVFSSRPSSDHIGNAYKESHRAFEP